MRDSRLEDETCRECGRAIRVARTMPYDGREQVTGAAAERRDDVTFQTIAVGWICLSCAKAAAQRKRDDDGPRGTLVGPGPGWVFVYDKRTRTRRGAI